MTTFSYSPTIEDLSRKFRARQLLTWFLIIAIVMFFAGLTSAYVVSMSGGYWVDIRLPDAFLVSTACIVVSSLFLQMALHRTRLGRTAGTALLIALALAFGVGFAISQVQGWGQLVGKGNFVVGKVLQSTGTYGKDWSIRFQGQELVLEDGKFYLPDDTGRSHALNADLQEQKNTASSYIYALTAAHLAHLALALVSLLVMLVQAARGAYSKADHAGLWAGTMFWHFLGFLWIYLFLFLTFVH